MEQPFPFEGSLEVSSLFVTELLCLSYQKHPWCDRPQLLQYDQLDRPFLPTSVQSDLFVRSVNSSRSLKHTWNRKQRWSFHHERFFSVEESTKTFCFLVHDNHRVSTILPNPAITRKEMRIHWIVEWRCKETYKLITTETYWLRDVNPCHC